MNTRLFCPASLLLLTCIGSAQLPPPANVAADARVKGLQYDSAVTGGQARSFTFTASVPSPYVASSVNWFVDGGTMQSEHSTSFTWKAVGVGKHYVTAKVITTGGKLLTGTLTFAAIGGPLTYCVHGKQDGVTVPEHDHSEPRAPWHLQYFDYTGTPPSGAQANQKGTVSNTLMQLGGTTITWSHQGSITLADSLVTGSNASVDVVPTAGSDPGAIRVTALFSYTDPTDSTLSGSASDDSLQTPPPGETSLCSAYYSFTSHRPSDVAAFLTEIEGECIVGTVWDNINTAWAFTQVYAHQLLDQNGDGQEGVWVQERFLSPDPGVESWNAATGQSIAITGNNNDTWWTTVAEQGVFGVFNAGDELGITPGNVVCNQAHPNPGAYPWLYNTQKHYAATHLATPANAWGILVATWLNGVLLRPTLEEMRTTHVKQ